ncbi:hypothetical protein RS030_81221 [Cryptosporidium xiaoi]|uniref:PH domain-containing protein n=1 Tax=Cryptosporidium xiaoi TaxID=659607 RepID=A0AAV9XUA7_9CRYT
MESTSKPGEEYKNEPGIELKTDEKDIGLNMELDELVNLSGSIVNNFPVITGYYGIMLRKKRHPLFGSYWSKECCLIQSNMFVCHKLKYPYCITKCISIASIVKCEISIIDPCVFCISVDNKLKMENKNTNRKKSKVTFFCFKNMCTKRRIENIKFKCISTLDTQKWISYINNNIKTWKLNKNASRNLFSGTNYIEKTVAQEVFEKLSKKMRKIVYQSHIQNFISLLQKHYLKQLYYSFNKLHLNYILIELSCKDDSSITTYKTNATSDNELYRNDLLLIKKRILTFKHEQGINNLNRIINRKKMNYWMKFVESTAIEVKSNNGNDNFIINNNTAFNVNNSDNYMDIYYNQVKLRKCYYHWKALSVKRRIFNNHIELLNSYKSKYGNNGSSLASTEYYPTYCTSSVSRVNFLSDNNYINYNCVNANTTANNDYDIKNLNTSPDISSSLVSDEVVSSNITGFTKHHVYCSEENIQDTFDVVNSKTKSTRVSTKTSYNIVSSVLTNKGPLPNKSNFKGNEYLTENRLSLEIQQNSQKKSEDELIPAHDKNIIESKKKITQLIKLNQIILKKKRGAWSLLQANIIQNKVLLSIYKYNQILSFLQIASKMYKLKLYKAFMLIRSSGGKRTYGV